MRLPPPRITLRQLIITVATLQAGLAVFLMTERDANPALGVGIVTACIATLAIVRTRGVLAQRRDEGQPLTVAQSVALSIGSFFVAVCIIGLCGLAFWLAALSAADYFGPHLTHTPRLAATFLAVRYGEPRPIAIGLAAAIGCASVLRWRLWRHERDRGRWLRSFPATLLILVVLPAAEALRQRRNDFRERALIHESNERHFSGASWAVFDPNLPPDAKRAAYHRRMRLKYERAARYPWLPVAADSPPP
jgi:MFS family permease